MPWNTLKQRQNQLRELPDSLVGWNKKSHDGLTKNVPRWTNKTNLRVLWHKQTHGILKTSMISCVSYMQKFGQKNITCNNMQRARKEDDVAQFS